jgi:sugar phosphate isomerase/epimerase
MLNRAGDRPTLLDRAEVAASFYTLSGAPMFEPSRFSLQARATAASEAGLSGIGLSAQDYSDLRKQHPPSELRAIVDDHGVGIYEVEFLYGWELSESGPWKAYEELLFEMGSVFDAKQVNLGSVVARADAPPVEAVAQRFRKICDRAAPHGLRVALEPLATSYLNTVGQAAEIVSLAAAENGGLVVDSYHFFRAGESIEALTKIPPEHIIGIQLNDATAERRGDLRVECVTRRRLPGEGEFDLVGFLRTLDAVGVDVPLTVETLSVELRERPVREIAARTVDAVRGVVALAREESTR